MIQTDNSAEFTNTLLGTKAKHKTLFEEALFEMGIEYHRIRIATPCHNGKVERQHQIDEQRFYKSYRCQGRVVFASHISTLPLTVLRVHV